MSAVELLLPERLSQTAESLGSADNLAKSSVKITWCGSQRAFEICCAPLKSAFVESTVPWRKKGNQFPTHISLPLTFVPFDSQLLISTQPAHADRNKLDCALCHLYFIDCLDVEEYRSSVRSDVVEWFASMRDAGCADWLIIVDSSRARDNKTRAPLIERLKSDFAKYLAKLIEIESGSAGSVKMPALIRSLKEMLVFALDSLIVSCEDALQADKERFKELDWDFLSYVKSQLALSDLYRSLGLRDQVLAQCDEIEALLSVLISDFGLREEKPKWLQKMLKTDSMRCPSVLRRMRNGKEEEKEAEMSLLDFRLMLLSSQLVALLDLYSARSRAQPSANTSRSLHIYFCGLILQYTHKCLTSITDELASLQIQWDRPERNCWTALFSLEVFHLCKALCDPAQVDSAKAYTCRLWIEMCKAVNDLGDTCGLVPGTNRSEEQRLVTNKLTNWLDASADAAEDKTDDALPAAKLRHLLGSQEAFGHLMQKMHESAMAVLKHFSWKRHARLLGNQLANFLVKSDRLEGALPYYSKLLNSLAKEGWSTAYVQALESVVTHFDAQPDVYAKELIDYAACLAVDSSSAELRRTSADKFIRLVAVKHSGASIRLEHRRVPANPFVVLPKLVVEPVVAIPDQPIDCRLTLISRFPIDIEHVRLRLCWRSHSASTTQLKDRLTQRRTTLPRFDCGHEAEAARFSCVTGVNRLLAPRASDAVVVQECPGVFVVQTENESTIAPGENNLVLRGRADEVGGYYPDHLDVIIGSITFVVDIESDLRALPFRVRTEPPSVAFAPLVDEPLGGVAQSFSLDICSGTDAIEESSKLTIRGVEGSALIEFETENVWSNQLVVDMPPLKPREKHSLKVNLCCLLESLVDGNAFKAKLKVDWLDRSWTFDYLFNPIIYLKATSSLLEDKVLLEVEVIRSHGEGTVNPIEATLLESHDSSESPSVPSKLMNADLDPIVPNSRHNLVWFLSRPHKANANPAAPREYRLELRYTVGDSGSKREYRYCDRLLLYEEKADYELCCQISSQQPQAVLCRADTPCDLVVSLRSLRFERTVETVLISLDADASLWIIEDRQKLLPVKESGLGQVAFSIVPKAVGYLPYPSIALRKCQQKLAGEKLEEFGGQMRCFVRTQGKQVHVLSPLPKTTAELKKGASHLIHSK
uniref:TRAPPC10/Trs130 N-terminal domain-containing protein n=1 Tax=Plectus sambesii TaxID=2011161 RepID=A0A914WL58_9BILA